MSALFPFSWHWWWGAFTSPSDLAACLPSAPELWHFVHQWPLLEWPLQVDSMQDSCHSQGSGSGCSWGTVGETSVVCFSEVDGLGRRHGWPCQYTSQPLQIQQHNTCDWYPVGWILFCHDSPWGAPSAAWCWHQGWLEWACIGLWTQCWHCYHHLIVHGRWVNISYLRVHQQICLTSSWHPPVHRHGLVGRSCHLRLFWCNWGISLDLICGLHLVGPSGP